MLESEQPGVLFNEVKTLVELLLFSHSIKLPILDIIQSLHIYILSHIIHTLLLQILLISLVLVALFKLLSVLGLISALGDDPCQFFEHLRMSDKEEPSRLVSVLEPLSNPGHHQALVVELEFIHILDQHPSVGLLISLVHYINHVLEVVNLVQTEEGVTLNLHIRVEGGIIESQSTFHLDQSLEHLVGYGWSQTHFSDALVLELHLVIELVVYLFTVLTTVVPLVIILFLRLLFLWLSLGFLILVADHIFVSIAESRLSQPEEHISFGTVLHVLLWVLALSVVLSLFDSQQ